MAHFRVFFLNFHKIRTVYLTTVPLLCLSRHRSQSS